MNIFDFTQYNRLLIHILFIGLTRKKWQKKHTHKEQEKKPKEREDMRHEERKKKPRRDGQIKKRVLYQ
jgi:hypothetical protein